MATSWWGVEPGNLAGVDPIDPETLVGKIRACVGDAIRWTPEYVTVDGVEVLVVISAPRNTATAPSPCFITG